MKKYQRKDECPFSNRIQKKMIPNSTIASSWINISITEMISFAADSDQTSTPLKQVIVTKKYWCGTMYIISQERFPRMNDLDRCASVSLNRRYLIIRRKHLSFRWVEKNFKLMENSSRLSTISAIILNAQF